jgi:hypothetical protein
MTESSATGFRCGLAYFSQPPAERKMQRMDAYPPTQPDAVCDRYQDREHKLRTDLSARGTKRSFTARDFPNGNF